MEVTFARNIVNLPSTVPSPTTVDVTNKDSRAKTAPAPKRMCDMSQNSKAPFPKEFINTPGKEKATDAQGDKTKLQVAFGMEGVNAELSTREKVFPKENLLETCK